MLLCGAAACAREEMPPGHTPDFDPPGVTEMFPPYGAAVPDLSEDAFIRFDEPLGDPASVGRTLVTSPAWEYEVHAGRRNARIRPRDGWRRDVVYRFTIPPGLRDLIRNQTEEPIEFLFTTGAELTATEAAGRVLDRETVRALRGASVLVIGGDSVPYTAQTDTAGTFALPSLPVGAYWAFGFEDQNSNRQLDRDFEPYDSAEVLLEDPTVRREVELWLVAPDTTPPTLVEARAVEEQEVRLEFDDLLEPDFPLVEASVRIANADTGEEWPVEEIMVGVPESVVEDSAASVPDSVGAEPAAGGIAEPPDAAVPADSGGVAPAAEEEAEEGSPPTPADPDSIRARPQRFVTVGLARALDGGTYRATVWGFANLRLLVGGGDTTFVYEPPPVPGEDIPLDESGNEAAPSPDDAAPPAPDDSSAVPPIPGEGRTEDEEGEAAG